MSLLRSLMMGSVVAVSTSLWGAEDPGVRAMQQHQLHRQHQQDALQLRMQQYQRGMLAPLPDPAAKRERERMEIDQRQRQQALHYRQSIDPPVAQPSDDAGTRGAKARAAQQRKEEEGARQLRRFDEELARHGALGG